MHMPEPEARPSLQPINPLPPSTNNAATQALPARGQSSPKNKGVPPAEPKDGTREIVETVVFVVVLVLLLKSFVAEAFVIPTGSMAETLYGYQKMVTCPKCGHSFPVNCSSEVDPQQGPPIPVVGGTCPNCRYAIDFKTENMKPNANTGDRVLVAKFLYDLDILKMNMPKRFDVVVFKYPKEPQKNFAATNYIKRLIGLPRETIAIYYGKLYVYEGLDYTLEDRDVPAKDLWEKQHMHENDPQAKDLFSRNKFRILRKPPAQMLAERRLVYDNDRQAEDLIEKVPPRWGPEVSTSPWSMDHPEKPRLFRHAASAGSEVDWLHYRHYIPEADRLHYRRELITDFMGYNTGVPDRGFPQIPPQSWVGDLMLECDVDVGDGAGELVLELSKGVDRFRARLDLASGVCTLVRITNGKEEKLDSKETPLKKPGKYTLRFANFDERLTLWVNSSLPFGDGCAYEAPSQRGPTEQNDLQPASIGVSGNANVSVSNLRLWRDTYYTNDSDPPGIRALDFGNPADWDVLRSLEPRTMYVQPGHFLCLGDNSPQSSDGRSWGLVPHRLLLGRALVIYYPFWPVGERRAGPIH
jgi:signal peptidase I